ncbi:uncharacterized protein CIMG_10068 [Coccidioides immitis RS]|uniref:Uncharacterized protein n=1 Tax=Coccidioides immitis (strain RS) TaxID=246410 RepID=J3K0R6_COCIM|nr:uncharacterized protein CIMG_10068 [Coccidioides immitis RS]EAS27463.3 hypothetical protein CIMG_10068 [Coccidioides immitis RS]
MPNTFLEMKRQSPEAPFAAISIIKPAGMDTSIRQIHPLTVRLWAQIRATMSPTWPVRRFSALFCSVCGSYESFSRADWPTPIVPDPEFDLWSPLFPCFPSTDAIVADEIVTRYFSQRPLPSPSRGLLQSNKRSRRASTAGHRSPHPSDAVRLLRDLCLEEVVPARSGACCFSEDEELSLRSAFVILKLKGPEELLRATPSLLVTNGRSDLEKILHAPPLFFPLHRQLKNSYPPRRRSLY